MEKIVAIGMGGGDVQVEARFHVGAGAERDGRQEWRIEVLSDRGNHGTTSGRLNRIRGV